MKRLFLMVCMAFSIVASWAQTEADFMPYAQRWDSIGAQMNALGREYGRLTETVKDTAQLKLQIKPLIAKAEACSKARIELFWQMLDKFKHTKFPARYVPEVMWNLRYDDLVKVMDPSTGYYSEKEMSYPRTYFENLSKRKPGSTVKELTMTDINGKAVRLTDYVGHGKYVLVDFWASWCGPCRQEMPNVVEAYRKYGGKQFEIVGVSFDSKAESWKSAVKELGMTWPQMSDLKGWKSVAAGVYGIQSIPASILFDPKGVVVDIDLRGNLLQEKLAQLLGR